MANINGFEYGWSDVEIAISGNSEPLVGVTNVEYDTTRENSNVYGKGSKPIRQVRGKKEPKNCSVTMLQTDYEEWIASLGKGKDLTDLAPFVMTVSYAAEGSPRVTDRLENCLVNGQPKAIGTDKKNMEIKIDLTVMNIAYNV